MKMTIGTGYGSLSCGLSVADDMAFTSEVSCEGYMAESIRYAVCRFLRKNRQACGRYVTMSYKMRFAKGKARKAKLCKFTAPAKLLELPGGSVETILAVDPTGVTVRSVSLSLSSGEERESGALRWVS